MQAIAEPVTLLALLNLGGGEIILILALILILLAFRTPPGRRGLFHFFKAASRVADEMDEGAASAGRSLGGIYGKPAAQALTPDNHVAELYDPAAFRDTKRPRKLRAAIFRTFLKIRSRIGRFLLAIRRSNHSPPRP